jgi:3-deoxy-D-manno-octulosonic-acid transferase
VLLVLLETELWPNLIHHAHERGARIAVVNGRISPRSFPRYRRARPLLRHVLAEVDLFLMQGDAHRARLLEMGAPADRVHVVGNLKYDALAEPETPLALRRALGQDGPDPRPLLVVGSTVEGEEAAAVQTFLALRGANPAARMVIAPRHPERFASVAEIVTRAGLDCARRTQLPESGWTGGDVLVLDTLGELASVYPLATLVFVGGSLAEAGGHNVLEPAVAGRAIIVGPHMENFREIAAEFLAEDALVQVPDAAGLSAAVARLFADAGARAALGERARRIVARNRGALERTVDGLAGLLVPGHGETRGLA